MTKTFLTTLFAALFVFLAHAGASAQLSSPIAGGRVTSHFSHTSRGRTVNYACTAMSRSGHRGTDYGVPIGTTISAAAAGTVGYVSEGCSNRGSLSSRCGGGFGNYVTINHADGRTTYYAHMTPGSIRVRVGQRVECGTVLGQSGNSGRSTGPHLHFEIRAGGGRIDPYGGACSTQSAHLWNSGASAAQTCSAMPRMGDDSTFVRAALPDTSVVQPGEEVTQRWTLRNSGTTTWSTMGAHRLEHAGGPTLEGLRRMDVSGNVAPNATHEFTLTVRAPSMPGTYTARYRMMSTASASGFGTVVTIKFRVARAPRSCSSMTLGRTVPNGECVQVDYAACGASSCSWFRCADGAWQCTGEAGCGGETHESARCDRPTEMECASAAEPCTSVAECCGGLLCANAASGGRQCCAGPEMPCESDGDCCGNMACGAGGTCECVPVGSPASSTLECCGSAYRTSRGVCGYDT
ncbi:MAG: peptidoglycan DD-metalloendopeptidase family protein [Deltaproteobacteria bacterium]|nr:peptidoglycan DD-metalloendopeptidase family protein [Deltaproteobacteria bacterium]